MEAISAGVGLINAITVLTTKYHQFISSSRPHKESTTELLALKHGILTTDELVRQALDRASKGELDLNQLSILAEVATSLVRITRNFEVHTSSGRSTKRFREGLNYKQVQAELESCKVLLQALVSSYVQHLNSVRYQD